MKKFRYILLAMTVALLSSACHTEINERINALKINVNELENTLATINSNITALSEVASALESNDNIVSIVDLGNGYRVTFANTGTVDFMKGVDGVTPIIGISKHYDGEYYWTIQMGENGKIDWLTNLGVKCNVSSSKVQVAIQNGNWCYSVDGGITWKVFSPCTGEAGKTVFNSIDTSDPYYVTFNLSNGESFTIIRESAYEQMKEFCKNATEEFNVYQKLVTELDTTMFIKNVTEKLDDAGNVIGYTFTFAGTDVNGKTMTILNGKDITAEIEIMISKAESGERYWMYRLGGEGDFDYIQIDSVKLRANLLAQSPEVNVKDSLGVYYLTLKYGLDGKVDWMRDNDGNLIRLTKMMNFDWFNGVEVGQDSIALTLKDSSVVILPKYNSKVLVPTMTLAVTDSMVFDNATQAWKYVEPSKSYTIKATIENYSENVKVSALVLDGSGYIKSVTDTCNVIPIVFKTSSEISPFVSVAVFMTWEDNTIMKVVKYVAKPKEEE